jgi:hypothetical protein
MLPWNVPESVERFFSTDPFSDAVADGVTMNNDGVECIYAARERRLAFSPTKNICLVDAYIIEAKPKSYRGSPLL